MKSTYNIILIMASSLCIIGCKNEYEKYKAGLEKERKAAESAALAASFSKPAKLPIDEIAKITGRGSMTGDYFVGTLYNGSSYTLAYVEIVLQLQEEQKQFKKNERVLRVERLVNEKETGADGRTVHRKVVSEWPPFTATDVSILSGGYSSELGTNTLSWGVWDAYGFKR